MNEAPGISFSFFISHAHILGTLWGTAEMGLFMRSWLASFLCFLLAKEMTVSYQQEVTLQSHSRPHFCRHYGLRLWPDSLKAAIGSFQHFATATTDIIFWISTSVWIHVFSIDQQKDRESGGHKPFYESKGAFLKQNLCDQCHKH